MKTVKVSIQDENTLVLQEDGAKGDLIDLKSIHETDIDKATIEGVVGSIKRDKFEEELNKALEAKEREYALQLQLKEKELGDKTKDTLIDKDAVIADLLAKLEAADNVKELAVTKAVGEVKNELTKVTTELSSKDKEKETLELQLKEKYEGQIRDREDTIERLKDMKAKLSVKLLGESLEQHCQNEFNSVRTTMFPFAYSKKTTRRLRTMTKLKVRKATIFIVIMNHLVVQRLSR